MDRVKNIEKMEKIMNDHEALLEEVNKVLDKPKGLCEIQRILQLRRVV